MTDKDLWTTFEKTGRILDYLQYKNLYEGEYKDYYTSKRDENDGDQIGEESIESDSNSNRHDTVRSTYRGI